jgi:HEAT repeat protein
MPLVRKGSEANSPPAPRPTAAALSAAEESERWAAARALNAPEDVPALSAALARETSASVREAILTSLCRIATPESAAAIVPAVRSDDASVRRGALDALISMPQAAAPHLPALLADDDSDVRLLSCEIVRALPSDQATELLIEALNVEDVPNVCAAAIDVLTEIGAPAALPVLKAVAERFGNEPFLQFAIKEAVARISAASAEERG